MARLLRVLLKLAILGGIIAVVVKVLQSRSHPAPVVDRNAYNSWEPLKETTPVAPAAAPADPPVASNGAITAKATPADDAGPPAKTEPAKKAATKKKAAAKKAAPKKAAAKKSAAKKAPTKKAAAKKATGEDSPPAEPVAD